MSVGTLPIFREDGSLRENFIYILVCYEDGESPIYVKVGRSMRPGERLCEIKVGCPVQARLLYFAPIFPMSAVPKVEKAIHKALADSRIRGEWFRSTSRTPLSDDGFSGTVGRALRGCGIRKIEWATIDVVEYEQASLRLRTERSLATRRVNRAARQVVGKQRYADHREDREAALRVLAAMRAAEPVTD